MEKHFYRTRQANIGGYVAINVVPLVISVIYFVKHGIWAQFLINAILLLFSLVHYFVKRKKRKPVLSVYDRYIFIDDGFSFPKLGKIKRSEIARYVIGRDKVIELVLKDGSSKKLNAQILSQKDWEELVRVFNSSHYPLLPP